MMPSQFDLLRLRDETFVREVDFHWTIESTNSQAVTAAGDADAVLPLLVLAETQTAGRGRGSNQWLSAEGSLTFSVVIPLDTVSTKLRPQVALATGLAICRTVEQFAPHADLGLKWPNDVYVDDKKVAGILIELPAHEPPRCIIGVGVNVNNEIAGELADIGTSLTQMLGHDLDLTDFLVDCLKQLERGLADLQNGPEQQVDQWRAYDYLLGRVVEVNAYGNTIRGTACGIDASGALCIETDTGVETCLGGIVTLV